MAFNRNKSGIETIISLISVNIIGGFDSTYLLWPTKDMFETVVVLCVWTAVVVNNDVNKEPTDSAVNINKSMIVIKLYFFNSLS